MAEDTSSPEAPPAADGTQLRTFLIADVRGYTRWTQEHGDEAASALATRFAGAVRETVPEFGGELLELRGDEALCVFGSARQALRAAVGLQRRFRTPDGGGDVFPLGVGVGLDAGEAVPTEGGYRGGALNLAARLCAIAKPGEVLASDGVVHMARHVDGLRLVPRRAVRLKGVAEPVRLVEVVPEEPLPRLPIAPASAHPRGAGAAWSRDRRVRVVAGIAVVIAAGVAAGILAASGGGGGVQLVANSLGRIDPTSGRLVSDVRVGVMPNGVAGSGDAIWVSNFGDRTVARVPRGAGIGRVLPAGGAPTSLCVGGGFVWIALGFQNQVSRIAVATGEPAPSISVGGGPDAIVYADGAAWVALKNDDAVERISRSGRVGPRIRVGKAPTALAYAAPNLWVANSLSRSLSRISVRSRAAVGPDIKLRNPPSGVAVGAGSVWVTSELGNSVTRVDPVGGSVVMTIMRGIGEGPVGIAATPTSVWVASPIVATLAQIDPRGNRVVRTLALKTSPDAVASFGGAIWVTGHRL